MKAISVPTRIVKICTNGDSLFDYGTKKSGRLQQKLCKYVASAMQHCYNPVNFLKIPHKKHP